MSINRIVLGTQKCLHSPAGARIDRRTYVVPARRSCHFMHRVMSRMNNESLATDQMAGKNQRSAMGVKIRVGSMWVWAKPAESPHATTPPLRQDAATDWQADSQICIGELLVIKGTRNASRN